MGSVAMLSGGSSDAAVTIAAWSEASEKTLRVCSETALELATDEGAGKQ